MANSTLTQGIIYCVRNPLFPHLVKIGKTTKNTVEERGLSNTSVPEDFETVWAYKVSDIKYVEGEAHRQCKSFEYVTKNNTGRKTEFFYELAIKPAEDFVKNFPGAIDCEEEFAEHNKIKIADVSLDTVGYLYDDNDLVSWEDLRLMRPDNDRFKTEERGSVGWLNATNNLRMAAVKIGKRVGAWKDKKLSLAWLKSAGYYDKIMKIEWDDSE